MATTEDSPQSPQDSPSDTGRSAGPVTAPPPVDSSGREMDREARMWAMFCHLAALSILIVPGIGLAVGPLVVWLFQKDRFPFVDEQGKEAVNFQITILLYVAAGAFLAPLWGLGYAVMIMAVAVSLFFMAFAAVKAHHGYHYRYPFPLIIRVIR